MAVSKDEILDAIAKMSLMDVVELISDMEKKFGVTAAAPVAVAAAGGGAAAAAAPAEEKTEFTVVLKEYPADKKVTVIKVVRELTGLGLKEAKDLVEAVPGTVKDGVKALASLPSLDELRAKIVGLVQAPATKIAQLVNAPAAKVARVVQAYASKNEAA